MEIKIKSNKKNFLQTISFQQYNVEGYQLKTIKGFSIIELMVVISIIGIMSSLMFANYRQGERDTVLIYAAQQTAQDIRQAQNLSLAGPKDTYGYGIYFNINNPTQYFIYGDEGIKNGNHQYEGEGGNDTKVSPYPIFLSKNIKINNIKINGVDSNSADIFFAPPDPVTYINGVSSIGTAEIKICFTIITTNCKTIIVTTAGRIEVDKVE
jgi:prepilin-type N-terminal cleavage/methylation domain-containing protein